MTLLTPDGCALFLWIKQWFIANDPTGVICAVFRNEAPEKYRSSELIQEAEVLAWERWPGERLFTYVDPREIKSSNPGFCFLSAGWQKCGVTAAKHLVILEVYP